jgi:hypothetical protein
MVHTKVRNLTTELVGLNSVYLPRKTSDSTHSILFIKDELEKALVSFSAYYGKRLIRGFRNRPLTIFPYNESSRSYEVSVDSVRFYLPKMKNYELSIKVNGDRYRTIPEQNRYRFMYVRRKDESITVDLIQTPRRGATITYKNLPLASLPFDAVTGYYVIDKNYVKELELKKAVTRQ